MAITILQHQSITKLNSKVSENPDLLKSFSYHELIHKYNLLETSIDEIDIDTNIKLELPSGTRDLFESENAKLIGKALVNLTPYRAKDERLWVTLSLREYKDYTHARWPNAIQSHTFIGGNKRNCMNRHSIGRLWWFYEYAKRSAPNNTSQFLDNLLFDSNFRLSLTERNSLVSIPNLVSAITNYAADQRAEKRIFNSEKFKIFMKKVNFLAGRHEFSALSTNQVNRLLEPLLVESDFFN